MKKKLISGLIATVMMAAMFFSCFEVAAAAESPLDSLVAEDIILSFTANNFSLPYADLGGDTVVEDADSSVGKAACFSYDKRLPSGDSGLVNAMIRVGNTHNMYVYNRDTGEPLQLGSIGIEQMQTNAQKGGYAVYKFDDVAMMTQSGSYYIFMFDCWGFQQQLTSDQVNALVGQTVDIYVSMKVTGNVSSTTEGDTPAYYIDRLVIAKSTSTIGGEHDHTYSEWVKSDDGESHSSACSICGEQITEPHSWDEGEVTKEPTPTSYGEKKYKCTACGASKYEELDKIRDEVPGDTEETQKSDAANKPSKGNHNSVSASGNVVFWAAIGLFVLAAIVIVAALVLYTRVTRKKNN